jgi:hypothetical protein
MEGGEGVRGARVSIDGEECGWGVRSKCEGRGWRWRLKVGVWERLEGGGGFSEKMVSIFLLIWMGKTRGVCKRVDGKLC